MINVELRHLRSFVCLAEELHFGRAAARLNIVQPALSAQIRAMETALGTPLFIRDRRSVSLTEPGRLLLPEACATLSQFDRGIDTVKRGGRGEIGHLRIGYTGAAVSSGLLSRLLRTFRREAAEVTFDFDELHPALQREALLTGRIDVGFMPIPGSDRIEGLRYRVVERWPLALAMPQSHPLALLDSIPRDRLRGLPFVVYASRDFDLGGDILHRLEVQPSVLHRAATVTLLLTLVSAELGLALVPASLEPGAPADITFRPLDDELPALPVAAIHRLGPQTPVLRRFIDSVAPDEVSKSTNKLGDVGV